MIKIIETKNLELSDLPRINANWEKFSLFALSWDPKTELVVGKFPYATYSIDQRPNEDSSILEIRAYLYARQRWWNNQTHEIDAKSFYEIHKIIEILRNKLQPK